VISASAEAAIAELNEIVRADGAELRLADASPSSIRLELDLSESTCTECVVTKELLLEILTARLATVDPDILEIKLYDPRESQVDFIDP